MNTRFRRAVLVLAACWALVSPRAEAAASACSPDVFLKAPRFPAGDTPSAVAIADFNNDTFPDIAVASDGLGVSVLLGDGSGGFGAPVTTAEGAFGGSALAADLDGDGTMDLAVGGDGIVSAYIGNGDGTFQSPVSYQLSSSAKVYSLVAAKLDANDTLDIAAANFDEGVWILLGNGDGTFAAATPVPTGSGPGSVDAGDLNGDGKIDLVATTNQVAILLGNGDGTFAAPSFIDVGIRLGGVAVGDVDGDGKLDLGVTVRAYGEVPEGFVGILLGNGDGTFQAAVETLIGGDPTVLLLRDVDGDGFMDAVANLGAPFNSFSDQFGVLHGNGTAGFASAATYLAGANLRGPAAGDLDLDGQIDLVAAIPGDGEVSILFANGDATYRSVVGVPSSLSVYFAAIGDFDSDGVADAVFTGYDTHILVFSSGLGDARFGPPHIVPTPDTITPVDVFAADLDQDGKLDLVVTGSQILLGNGDGTFQLGENLSGFGARLAADVDGNGILDLVGDSGAGIEVELGNGDGTFGDPVITPTTETNRNAMTAGDLNGDGKADLAYYATPGLFQPTAIYAALSNGDGSFTPTYSRESASFVGSGIAIRDVTGDGKADILGAEGNVGLQLYQGLGDGTFVDPTTIDAQYSSDVFVADFDGDAILDILTTNANPFEALFFGGQGGGVFDPPVHIANGGARGQALAAVAGAGPDLVMIRNPFSSSASLSFLLNSRLTASVADRSVIVGSAAVLEASASGFGELTYQWRKDGVPLADGGPISGATTATLTIDPVTFTDTGSYDVVVTDSCTNTTSNAATLSVEFDDVPLSNPFHNDILTIATLGITGGCNTGTSYCPANPVSRAEMAVFLLKAKFGASHVPPPPPPVPTFADVPANAFAAAWIEELASLGVTGGCGNGLYCPDAPVTRAEMAVFLLKTLLGAAYVPPDPAGIFADVPPNNFAIAWIEDLYKRGVTAGCATNPLRYCPDTAVPREQMATFLVRTFLLP